MVGGVDDGRQSGVPTCPKPSRNLRALCTSMPVLVHPIPDGQHRPAVPWVDRSTVCTANSLTNHTYPR